MTFFLLFSSHLEDERLTQGANCLLGRLNDDDDDDREEEEEEEDNNHLGRTNDEKKNLPFAREKFSILSMKKTFPTIILLQLT